MGEAEGTYRHERLGHKGVIDHLGAKLDEFATGVIDKATGRQLERIKNLAKRYGIDFDNMTDKDKSTLGQEYIAMITENRSKMPNQWNDLVKFIRQTLRAMGIDLRVSNTEIQALIGKVEQNKRAQEASQRDDRMMFLTNSDLDADGKPKIEVLREIAMDNRPYKTI